MKTVRQNGFTLVEIMIVVVIIGLLAALAIPNFSHARTNARRGTCINNMRILDAAKQEYALENNKDAATVPASDDVAPYMRSNAMPICPAGGIYSIEAIGTTPSCSKSVSPDLHVLP